MEKACLVTGKSSDLLAGVVNEADARERRTLVARSGALEVPATSERTSSISWNRRSALSARSVVLHAQNLYGRLSEALIVFQAVRETVPFHESSIVSVENRTDAEVKGYLFLIREIVAAFQKQGTGRLVLAVQDNPGEVRSPLEAMSVGAFRSVAESLQRYYQNEPLDVRLCYTRSEDVPGYAAFILDALDAPAKRRPKAAWRRFAAKGGLFSRDR